MKRNQLKKNAWLTNFTPNSQALEVNDSFILLSPGSNIYLNKGARVVYNTFAIEIEEEHGN